MAPLDDATLPPSQRLAVAYSPGPVRPAMLALLSFDSHLGRRIAGVSEPLIGQMRLAWWREELGKPLAARAKGNPELDALGETWAGSEPSLVALIDGWEHLLGETPLPEDSIEAFAAGRGTAFAGLAALVGEGAAAAAASGAGTRWALADLAFRLSDPCERDACLKLHSALAPERVRLPRRLRGLAILDALGKRAMARNEPPMSGRGAALLALRVGLLGR